MASKSSTKICIAGKNNIATSALLYTLRYYYDNNEIIVIPNRTDCGVDLWQKSLKKMAIQNNVYVAELNEIYDIKDLLFISLEFDRLIKIQKFSTDRLYNIHFSYLPKYKGMYTSVMPILYGEKYSGVTLHKIENGIDTGGIIAQKKFLININDTARDLYFKYIKYGTKLFYENIESLVMNSITLEKHSNVFSSYFSKKEIDFNNIIINLNKTSFEIHNQIRAFIFKEYQLPTINGYEIYKSKLTNEFIGYNVFEEYLHYFVISGIDGFKLLAYKQSSQQPVTTGGGG